MRSPLRILHLEDNLNDATLVRATLDAAGIVCEIICVQQEAEFLAVLEREEIDLVLSDFTLPKFDGLSAIKAVRDRWPLVPVILVSGTIGEEKAIDSMKSGATDYVLKERLLRLGPAVRRAMAEAEERAERSLLEACFIEAQKMEVIGQLAGGVAHDFNNILMVIIGYSDLMAGELDQQSPLRPFNEEIRLAAGRAAGLTRQLLVCSRQETVQPVVLELSGVVKELGPMLRRLIGENIQMEVTADAQGGRVLADSGYLGQVLMNLVVNARDAMPAGGRLSIATRNVNLAESGPGTCSECAAGDYVLLSVSDTGTGIAPEVKARLFEAFYTTKSAGKGTGLGLATCQTIVKLSGGCIDVRTTLGAGTSFDVYFPRVEHAEEPESHPLQSDQLPGGRETLLVVEDEPAVRHLACEVLRAHGYEVLSASNGQEGFEAVRAHQGEPPSLVVTDVVMPRMSGTIMAEWLKTIRPGLDVLFTSGYTDDVIFKQGVLENGVEFLPKPYTPATLLRKVRAILDRERSLPLPLPLQRSPV